MILILMKGVFCNTIPQFLSCSFIGYNFVLHVQLNHTPGGTNTIICKLCKLWNDIEAYKFLKLDFMGGLNYVCITFTNFTIVSRTQRRTQPRPTIKKQVFLAGPSCFLPWKQWYIFILQHITMHKNKWFDSSRYCILKLFS